MKLMLAREAALEHYHYANQEEVHQGALPNIRTNSSTRWKYASGGFLDQSKSHPIILYYLMQTDDLKSQIGAVSGQTYMAPYGPLRDRRQVDVSIYPETQHAGAQLIEPLFERQALMAIDNKTLAQLRDALLPMAASA